jgi:hypothetical protein
MLITTGIAGCVQTREELQTLEEEERTKPEAHTPVIDREETSR